MSQNKRTAMSNTTALSVLFRALSVTFRKLWPMFILMLLTAVGATLLELVPPFLLKTIIDSYLNAGITAGLLQVAIFYILASVGTSSIGFGQVFVNSYIGQNILLELRFAMAEHLTKLPMSYYSRTPVGDTMSRLTNDVETVNNIFGQSQQTSTGLSNLPTDTVKIIGVLIAMFTISPILTLIVLVAVPIVYFVSAYFRQNTYRTQFDVRRTVGMINTFLQETFSGMRTVKVYGKERQYGDRFQEPLRENLKAVNGAAVYDATFPCVMQVIRATVIATVIWFGAKTGLNEGLAISIGSLAAMADLISRLFNPIDAFTLEFQILQRAMAGLKRIVDLLLEKPEVKGETQRVMAQAVFKNNDSAIEVKGLNFSYPSNEPVLNDISLTIPYGRRVAIVGRTGAGKTTLMSLIAGLYTQDGGKVSVLGYDPYQVDPADRRKLLGVVPQNVHVFEGTIKENITLRDDTVPLADVEKAAKTVGLHDYIMSLSQSYDTLLGVEGTKLSRG